MKTALAAIFDEFYEFTLPTLVPRQAEFPLIPRKATVIIGMRRTGKTWFCYQKMQELLGQGIPLNRILYLNFDDDRLFGFTVSDFQSILDVYYARFPENKNETCYFFFDEIQEIDHWELFIRRILDKENIRVAITGSSSKLLGTEIATSLRGRTLVREMFPMNFGEYLRTAGILSESPKHFGSSVSAKLRHAVRDFFQSGGFPETIGLFPFERQTLLQGYVDSVLFRDIVERYHIKNVPLLRRLIQEILRNPGQKFSVTKFYNTMRSLGIDCDKNALYSYIGHLIDAFLFYRVEIHHKSERIRRVNPAKLYTVDPGILHTVLTGGVDNNGPVFENIVFNALRPGSKNIEYLQSAGGGEVDFLVTDHSNRPRLVQAAWSLSNPDTFDREINSLLAAGTAMNIRDMTVVTWDEEKSLENGIRIVPIWKFLLEE
ncbi:MAG: ATP-binding protein [Thermoguttaceae bacterium]|nr:ATP-binding protein [Thermoguttaceae bacterium]